MLLNTLSPILMVFISERKDAIEQDLFNKEKNKSYNQTVNAYIKSISLYGMVRIVFNDTMMVPNLTMLYRS